MYGAKPPAASRRKTKKLEGHIKWRKGYLVRNSMAKTYPLAESTVGLIPIRMVKTKEWNASAMRYSDDDEHARRNAKRALDCAVFGGGPAQSGAALGLTAWMRIGSACTTPARAGSMR
jgi:hypothetical protein